MDTWQSEKTRTKQEHYFNLSPPLIPASAFTQEEQLGVSQPPSCEQSITVSASLPSALAPTLPSLAYRHAWSSQVDAGKHCIPHSMQSLLPCPLNEVKHVQAVSMASSRIAM